MGLGRVPLRPPPVARPQRQEGGHLRPRRPGLLRRQLLRRRGRALRLFSAQGATIVGMTSPDDYDYSDSKALRDGQFFGLLCDEDNEYDKSEGRANDWVEQLKGEGVAF